MTATEYSHHSPRWADDALRFALRCCPSRPDCEDAVQEALASLWQCHGSVNFEKGKPYLLSATYRALMHSLRHARVELQHADTLRSTTPATASPDLGFDLREAIEHALLTLPEVQRAILQLRDVEGYSYQEIASTLSLSDQQVQVYLFRARVKMRKQLIQMGYDNQDR